MTSPGPSVATSGTSTAVAIITAQVSGMIRTAGSSMATPILSASAQITDAMKLTVGAENLFDTYPDEAAFQASRGLIYSRNAVYDTDGGLYYARLAVAF